MPDLHQDSKLEGVVSHAHKNPRSALVVEGGALRSVFSAGLLDGFLKSDFDPFDMYFGVSAGATNLVTFLSKQAGKSKEIYIDLALKKEFISYRRFFSGGHLINLDWLQEETFGNNWCDLRELHHQQKPFYVVLTNVITGKAEYIESKSENLAELIKATASLPFLYRKFPRFNDNLVTDGGIADGIPLKKAIESGADKIMVIRSRSQTYRKRDSPYHQYIRWRLKRYTQLVETMRQRVKLYEEAVNIIRNPPEGVNILEVCPPASMNLDRFTRDYRRLLKGYDTGFIMSNEVISQWNSLQTVKGES